MADQVMQVRKDEFLELHAEDYGYNGSIYDTKQREFCRVEDAYLDHVGAALYSKSQVENFANDLQMSIFGNPHSQNASSQRSSELIEEARNMIARHFHTTLDEHHVIFTSGATGALKLLAENFNWSNESNFIFLEDSHTSVVGIRELAKREGSTIRCITESELLNESCKCNSGLSCKSDLKCSTSKQLGHQDDRPFGNSDTDIVKKTSTFNLFSYPAMSNFCGRKYPLKWISLIKQGKLSSCAFRNRRWLVLLDAASYVGTNELNLSEIEADFIPVSFYKMFGFPTGVGALIIKADAISALKTKCYYGGGTVLSTISRINHHVLKNEVNERYEDGTLPFLDIIGIKHGFSWLKSNIGSMQAIKKHTFALAQFTFREMKSMRHRNGVHLCELYCDNEYNDCEKQGPVINFNIVNVNGDYVGYSQVEKLANLSKIHLRTGCFCNTGDCQKHLGLTADEMLSNFNAGHVCGDQMDIIDGKPTGSVRISFGYISTFEDAWTFLQFLRDCFLVSSDDCPNSFDFTSRVDANADLQSQWKRSNQNDSNQGDRPSLTIENGLPMSLNQSSQDTKDTKTTTDASLRHSNAPIPMKKQTLDDVKKLPATHLNGKIKTRDLADEERCDSSGFQDSSLDSHQDRKHVLKRIFIYPVKSCASFQVREWWISEKGLLYDREWMIVSEYGSVLTQKKEPRMVFIKPIINMETNVLILKCQGYDDVTVPLIANENTQLCDLDRQNCLSRICGDKVSCDDCGDEVAAWIGKVLGRPCRLVRQNVQKSRLMKRKSNSNAQEETIGKYQISLTNESQYLLISETSLLEIFKQFKRSKNLIKFDELADSFRANFIINGDLAFEEDNWKEVNIGELHLKITGKCQRCQMICINQNTAERNREPLETLVRLRGSKMEFGIYLVSSHKSDEKFRIRTGDKVIPVV